METTETPKPATENPELVRDLMLRALASSECMGIVQAAIATLEENGWILTRSLHKKWLKDHPEYAKEVNRLEEIGVEVQREAVILTALSTMESDASVLKAMLQRYSTPRQNATGKAEETPSIQGMSDAELLRKLNELQEFKGKQFKVKK